MTLATPALIEGDPASSKDLWVGFMAFCNRQQWAISSLYISLAVNPVSDLKPSKKGFS
jgi:hypothetical protein